GYMYAQPGKKLLFMGGEIGQWNEWRYDQNLDWHLLQYPRHQALQKWVQDLNRLYRNEPALHQLDCEPGGFEWIDCNNGDESVVSLIRKGKSGDVVLVACNFTPVPRLNYRIGCPQGGYWRELLNSDAADYWGSGLGNLGGVHADAMPVHGRPYSLNLTLPPLSVLYFKHG
ncbi:MAG: alpha amylase C-terminal domain-containing protein, partial [Chloroflexi bacterium]|nr:alpha amylase C-terminal domain-containing protein [Chloroflexota bacterium]